MLRTALLSSVSVLGALASVSAPARADILDELIARSLQTPSYHASYTLKFTVKEGVRAQPPPDSELSIEFDAPDRVRVENRMGAQSMSMWCVGDAMATQVTANAEGKGAMFGRVDLAELRERLRGVGAVLRESFPEAASDPLGPHYDGPAALINWSFDERVQRANFELVAVTSGVDSPLGWLDALRRKQAVLERDGDVLRFETDGGRFRGELAAADGMLRRLQGESPNGTFELLLVTVAPLPDDAAARFVPPKSVQGAKDTSAELRRSGFRGMGEVLRTRIYSAVARASEFDAPTQAKAEAVFREFYTQHLAESLASWFELAARRRATVVERLRAFAASGRSAEQVEKQRQTELAAVRAGLDELEGSFAPLLELSARTRKLNRAEALNTLERRVFVAVFDAQVRKPVLADYEAAFKFD
jgi:hypothetical protein